MHRDYSIEPLDQQKPVGIESPTVSFSGLRDLLRTLEPQLSLISPLARLFASELEAELNKAIVGGGKGFKHDDCR